MNALLSKKMLLAAGISASALSGLYYWWYCNREIIPKKWKKIGILDEIYYFPIKSCGGIKLKKADCENLGLRNGLFSKDRQFMLIDKNNKAVTARTYPKMVKIQPKVIEDELFVSAPNMDTIKIDFDNFHGTRTDIKAELWKQPVYLTECGSDYDKWFSKYILGKDEGLRLVYYPFPITQRKVDKKLQNSTFHNSDTGSLQDISSYLLLSDESIRDLNTRLERKVSHLHFRGNFMIKTEDGVRPYDEDNWNWIKIGNETIFRRVCPCHRCIFPNIDPFTAERDPNFEPVKTLKTYRILDNNKKDPVMGIQLGIRNIGSVQIGDDVYVDQV